MLSVYTSSASTFFADIKNLIERSIKQMERCVQYHKMKAKLGTRTDAQAIVFVFLLGYGTASTPPATCWHRTTPRLSRLCLNCFSSYALATTSSTVQTIFFFFFFFFA